MHSTTLIYNVLYVLEPMPISAPQSKNPNVIIPPFSPTIFEILTSTITPITQPLFPSFLLSILSQPENFSYLIPYETPQPSNLTHPDASVVKSNVDSDTELDVELIALPDRTTQPYSDQTPS